MSQGIITPDPIRAIVVDDEELSRRHVAALLARQADVRVVGEFESGTQALVALTTFGAPPEVAFLDVHMPDLDGLELVEALSPAERPEIIFVTGYDRYMERAFELHAVDYLRKPYTPERFASALEAARRRVIGRRLQSRLDGAVGAAAEGAPSATDIDAMLQHVRARRGDSRLAIRDRQRGTWAFVRKDEIDWIEADGDTQVRVRAGVDSFSWKTTLSEVERLLDPVVFVRVHRSYIVNAHRVARAKSLQKGEYALFFPHDGIVDTGRTYRRSVEALFAAQ